MLSLPCDVCIFEECKIGLARLSYKPILYLRNSAAWPSQKPSFDFSILGENLCSPYHTFIRRNGYFTFFNSAGLTLRVSKHGFITVFLRASHLPYYISQRGFLHLQSMLRRILWPCFLDRTFAKYCSLRFKPRLEQIQISLQINADYLTLVRTFGRSNPYLLALALEELCTLSSDWRLLEPRIKFSNSDPENFFGSRGLSTNISGKKTLIRVSANLGPQLTGVSPSLKCLANAKLKFVEFCQFLHEQIPRLEERYNALDSRGFLCKRYFSFGGIKY